MVIRPGRGKARWGGHDSWPPTMVTGRIAAPCKHASRNAPGLKRWSRPPGGEARGAPDRRRVSALRLQRERAEEPDQPAEERHREQPVPCHEVDRAARGKGDQRRIGVRDVIRRDDEWPFGRNVLDTLEANAEVPAPEEPDGRQKDLGPKQSHATILTQRKKSRNQRSRLRGIGMGFRLGG